MRFRPEQHLRRQSDIRAVRENGRRVDCRAFTVWWKFREIVSSDPAAGAKPLDLTPRVCVIASTAAVGASVQRNRAKRRLREVFREQQHLIPAACDLLMVARAGARTWDYTELKKRFSDACRQIEQARAGSKPNS